MSLATVLNYFFDTIKIFVAGLFSFQIAPNGISIGSFILLSLLLFVVVTNIWPRD